MLFISGMATAAVAVHDDLDDVEMDEADEAAAQAADTEEAVDYAPFQSKLHFFALMHFYSGDTQRVLSLTSTTAER